MAPLTPPLTPLKTLNRGVPSSASPRALSAPRALGVAGGGVFGDELTENFQLSAYFRKRQTSVLTHVVDVPLAVWMLMALSCVGLWGALLLSPEQGC